MQELTQEYETLKENDPAELQKAIKLTEVVAARFNFGTLLSVEPRSSRPDFVFDVRLLPLKARGRGLHPRKQVVSHNNNSKRRCVEKGIPPRSKTHVHRRSARANLDHPLT